MKSLRRIRLIHWHLFEDATIDCRGCTHFIGINGAGKSTVLDAVQFALVGGQRDPRFNQAAMTGGKRSLEGYVRGELGTEGRRYLRDDATAVVALEFENPDGSRFSCGAVVDAYADQRRPDIAYFIVHDAALEDEWFFDQPGQLLSSRAFQRHLKQLVLPRGARAQSFRRLEDYRVHLLNRLGQLRETFFDRLVKGVAFSPLVDIRAFVHSYLLDEELVDVANLQAQLETLRHFEQLVADVRERIVALDGIEEIDRERLAARRRRIANGYHYRKARSDALAKTLERLKLDLDEARLTLSRAEMQRDGLEERQKAAQMRLTEAQLALESDAAARRERELKARQAVLAERIEALEALRARHMAALRDQIADGGRLLEILAALPEAEAAPEWLAELASAKVSEIDAEDLAALADGLETLGRALAQRQALAESAMAGLRQEAEVLREELAQLRAGDAEVSLAAEMPAAARLRRRLRSELDLSEEELPFLCGLLEVTDEDWQNAVEGLLGDSRFALLVPPVHYQAAVDLYRRRREADALHGVALLDCARLEAAGGEREAGSLAELVEVESGRPAARAFVDRLLGEVMRAEDLAELGGLEAGVTREGFVRRHLAIRHLDPRRSRRWFIGQRALPRQIEQREARLAELEVEIERAAVLAGRLAEALALSRDKLRPVLALEQEAERLVELPGLREEAGQVEAELAAMDGRSLAQLRAAVTARQGQLDDLREELRSLERQIGGLQERERSLSSERIPELSQALEAARGEADRFLIEEEAEEAREEIEADYERRRERQPLAVVRDNAERYEGDHGRAEQRQREELARAKRGYSLRYDFPDEAEEGAERYLAERQKFIDSELPQYETRAAEQRQLAEQELVENFIHRLREQIEDARRQLEQLNRTLSELRFGGERFQFIARPEPGLREIHAMIMASANVLGSALFESGYRQEHQAGWDLLLEQLTSGMSEGPSPELRRLQDYRNYLQYDVRIHYPDGDQALLSRISAKKSGGETTTPFYVAMAASFAQTYRLTQTGPADTIRLAIFDEAFVKMDTARTAAALGFMRESGLQVLLATPPDRAAALLPQVDSLRLVVRKGERSFVLAIDKDAPELEAALGADHATA